MTTAVVHCFSGHWHPVRTRDKVAPGRRDRVSRRDDRADSGRCPAGRQRERSTASSPAPITVLPFVGLGHRVLAGVERGAPLERRDRVLHLLRRDRARRDRRLPPALHAPGVQGASSGCAGRWPSSARPRSRGRSPRGSPTTASTTRSPTRRATRTARTSTTGTASRARFKGLWHAHWGWLFIHTHRGNKQRYAPDLIADPLISRIDRLFVLWVTSACSCRSSSAG